MGETFSCIDDRADDKQLDNITENNAAGPPPAAAVRDASMNRSQQQRASVNRLSHARGGAPNSSPELHGSGQHRGLAPAKSAPALGYSEYEAASTIKPSGDSIDARMARRDMEQAVAAGDVAALERAIRKGKKSGWSEQEKADAKKQLDQLHKKILREKRRRLEQEAGPASPAASPSAEIRKPPAREQPNLKSSAASFQTMHESAPPIAATKQVDQLKVKRMRDERRRRDREAAEAAEAAETRKPLAREQPSVKPSAASVRTTNRTTVSEEEQEAILSKLQTAMARKAESLLQEAINLMENAGMDQSDDHKAKIRKARAEIKNIQRVAQLTAQRRTARNERRWDPKLGEAVNLDSMCEKYIEHGDRRSKTEFRKYYETLQIQKE